MTEAMSDLLVFVAAFWVGYIGGHFVIAAVRWLKQGVTNGR